MLLRSCCCCISLKIGVWIIAVLTLIQAISLLIASIVELTLPNAYVTLVNNTNLYVYLIGPYIIQFVVALCFIYGLLKEKKYFILPVVILKMIEIVLHSIAIIYVSVVEDPTYLVSLVLVAFTFYLWYVTFSFYMFLSDPETDLDEL